MDLIKKFKINGIPKDSDYNRLPFGRKIEYSARIVAFKESAKRTHISIKRVSFSKAFKEFKSLYKPTEYYMAFYNGPQYADHSVEIFYK